jgi:hypothetical protein
LKIEAACSFEELVSIKLPDHNTVPKSRSDNGNAVTLFVEKTMNQEIKTLKRLQLNKDVPKLIVLVVYMHRSSRSDDR